MDIKEIREWVNLHEHPTLTTFTQEALKFLLSEVERLEDKKAEMQVTIEDCKVEINKKWEDHSKLVIGLKDAVKNGNQRCAKLEKENAALREVVEKARYYLIGPVPINLEEEFARRCSVVAALEKIKEE